MTRINKPPASGDTLAVSALERIRFESLVWAILITGSMAVTSMQFAPTAASGAGQLVAPAGDQERASANQQADWSAG